MSLWSQYAKERIPLLVLLGAAAGCAVGAITFGRFDRWLSTMTVFIALAVAVQVYASGFFESLWEKFANTTRQPHGPSGRHAREVIRSSETPILNWVEARLFMDSRTSIALIVLGAVVQIIAIWIAP